MPRLAGVNLLGVLLGAIAMYFVGWMWFGMLFDTMWMEANGYTLEELEANFSPLIVFGGGFLVPLILTFALGWLLKKTGTTGLGACAKFGAILGLIMAAPLLAYGFIYNPAPSVTDLLLDTSHSFVGFVVSCTVLSFFE